MHYRLYKIIRKPKLFLNKFFRKKKNKFDCIISLGYNCEVTLRFYKFFGFEQSGLFNWTFSYSIEDLIFALENFSLLAADFKEPNPLWECLNTRIRFHGKEDIEIYSKNLQTPQMVEKDKKELSERIGYLKEKFLKIAKSKQKKLYIYKIKKEDIKENTPDKINRLYNALLNLGAENFKLLVVSEEKYKNKFKKSENYILRTVKIFADDNEVPHKKYIGSGWDDIYCEFWQEQNKESKKDKKYKFER